MADQYKIGEFTIDLSRNQITQNKEPKIIPPKALAVLTYLAKHQGKVISQDELLDNIWRGTVVSPNTLQRSIAQLRKALGDDGKEQTYIKTHAKQGYSLEQSVFWLSKDEPQDFNHEVLSDNKKPEPNFCTEQENGQTAENKSKKQLIPTTYLLPVIALILLTLITGLYFSKTSSKPFSIGQIRALTATDGKELASIYSPDGKYIIFHRYSEEKCLNDIWAKNLETQQEYKLSKNMDVYGQQRFSKDGKKIIVIRTVDCGEPITQKKCYQLMSLDFEKALNTPQEFELILECKNSEIRRPYWLNNNNIALMQKQTEQWQLVSYSIAENKSRVIHDGYVYHYDYSAKDDLLAVTNIKENNQYYIDIIDSDGKEISSTPINLPSEIKGYQYLRPNFSPLANTLIFSTGKQLFTMSFTGEIKNISIPVDEPFSSPMFHPDGDRGLVIKGRYDSDIVSINLQNEQVPLKTLARSNTAENSAVFQPNGGYIAFESERTGEEQVWLNKQDNTSQLTRFPIDSYVYGIKWSANNQALLIGANSALFHYTLDRVETAIVTSNPILELLHWDEIENQALVFAQFNGIKKLAKVDLGTGETVKLTDRQINWAAQLKNGGIVFTDPMDKFWISNGIEYQLIDTLNEQGGDNKRFLLKDNVIYGINNEYELWRYHLDSNSFETIRSLIADIDNISDIQNENLLVTKRQVANKEVVELVLSQ